MTKLLILSDSHNSASAVERILHAESDANAVVFLGDGLRDLEEALTLHPKMKVYAVDQVVVFYTHGHMYGVKYDLDTLADAAAARGAEVALFGHTHKPTALQKNGVFLFNPGSCGRCYTGPNTYGVMLLDKGKITSFAHKEVPQQ